MTLDESFGALCVIQSEAKDRPRDYADFGYVLENGRVVMDGTGEELSGERGRPRVLSRHRGRRPPELPGGQALPPAQAVAGLTEDGAVGSMAHYDKLETRDPAERERALFAHLPQFLEQTRERAPALATRLEGISSAEISDRTALARIPIPPTEIRPGR